MVRAPQHVQEALTPTEVLRWRFAATVEAPKVARGLVADVLPDDLNSLIVQLLVSELVTNAVLHTRRASELRVKLDDDVVRVEVCDTAESVPLLKPEAGAAGGWGLRIIAALSNEWGVERRRGGKVVWFELRRHDGSMHDAPVG